jgi:hypothetical protein
VSASSSETCLQLSHDGNAFTSTKIEAIDTQEVAEPVLKTFTGTAVVQEVSSVCVCVCVCPSSGSFHTPYYLPVLLTLEW